MEIKTIEVPFDYIRSYYHNLLGCDILICLKGKFHPYNFTNNQSIIPSDFEENGDWELKCFKHRAGHFLIIYLMNDDKKIFYHVNYVKNYEYEIVYGIRYEPFFQNLYDFKLELPTNEYNEYNFPTIIKNGEAIKLVGNCLKINSEDINLQFTHISRTYLIQDKLKTQAYIDDNNYLVYFFTYDDINSFSSG